MKLWNAANDPRGTLGEIYLSRDRKLELSADLCSEVLRWHSGLNALLALFRNIASGEPRAVSRIFLDRAGHKIERRLLGPVQGAAIMLDQWDEVTAGLHICEGVETGMAARQFDLKPTWALGSAGAIASFPMLGGVECLTLLQENDEASARACEACATRWHAAAREVILITPKAGKDINDIIINHPTPP
jgi:Toprim domain